MWHEGDLTALVAGNVYACVTQSMTPVIIVRLLKFSTCCWPTIFSTHHIHCCFNSFTRREVEQIHKRFKVRRGADFKVACFETQIPMFSVRLQDWMTNINLVLQCTNVERRVFAISWDLTFSSDPVSVRGLLVWPGSCNAVQNRK